MDTGILTALSSVVEVSLCPDLLWAEKSSGQRNKPKIARAEIIKDSL